MDIIDYIIEQHYQEKCKIISENQNELLTEEINELKEDDLLEETHYIKDNWELLAP
ncbi:hypothetical protein G6046_00675, partial [Bacillus amyloliquefaciens]|nr:hypothetical protein [Bacillus amyloliquefaciens]